MLNAKQKAEFIKDAPATEPPLQNNVKDLTPEMQSALQQLGRLHAFKVVECVRSLSRQKWLVKNGKSWTDKSNHLRKEASDLFALPLGYKTPASVWLKMHDDWDKIVKIMGRIPEPRIGKDLGHFGIMPE